jgi:2-haloacid dehalogenase
MIKNILFDLGGVLIDWNPKYLYKKIFETEEGMDYFLTTVCTYSWNEEQDGGRTIHEATNIKMKEYPQYSTEIKAYYDRWEEMLGGAIQQSVELLYDCLKDERYGVFALTNWSAETWPKAIKNFKFLQDFEGVLVSGEENLKKPDPAIFLLVASRYNLDPVTTLFIDDNILNIEAANKLGFQTIHFTSTDKISDIKDLLFNQQ